MVSALRSVASVGGGPGGLFTAILLRKSHPDLAVTVYERNAADDTFGFGVVFSEETLQNIADADPESIARIQCPVGLPEITSKEPAAIAVGIAAALLQAFARDRLAERTSR